MRVVVQRSLTRSVVAVAIGLIAVLAALDIGWLGWVYPSAETNEETGAFTTDGKAERRGDVAWAFTLGIGGGAAVIWGVRGMSGNRRILAADEDRLIVALGPPGEELWSVGWNEVFSVKSTLDEDDTGMTWALDIELAHDSLAPEDPRGARVEGDHVFIDAEDWKPPLEVVVGRLQVLLDRSRT